MWSQPVRGFNRGKPCPGDGNRDELPGVARFSAPNLVEGSACIVSLSLDVPLGMEAHLKTCMTQSELRRCHMLKEKSLQARAGATGDSHGSHLALQHTHPATGSMQP